MDNGAGVRRFPSCCECGTLAQPSSRRPGLEPGPILRSLSVRTLALDTFRKISATAYGSRLLMRNCAYGPGRRIEFSDSIPNNPERHCERSEAIHSFFVPRHGLLRFARNDGKTQPRVLAARSARGLQVNSAPRKQRAQGMPDARCTRGLVRNVHKKMRTRAYRAAEAIRHSLRDGFTAYIVLSLATGLSCHHRLRTYPQT
jgi:hypothetical protein